MHELYKIELAKSEKKIIKKSKSYLWKTDLDTIQNSTFSTLFYKIVNNDRGGWWWKVNNCKSHYNVREVTLRKKQNQILNVFRIRSLPIQDAYRL